MKNNWLNCLIVIERILRKKAVALNQNNFGKNSENTNIQFARDIVNPYKSHISMIKIEQVVNGSNISDNERFSFKVINETETKDILKNLDIKKTIDAIPPKLANLSANFFFSSITHKSHQHECYTKWNFQKTLISLDKGKPNKNEMANFKPSSVRKTFSVVYERASKYQIVRSMEKRFSPLLSVYKKNYSSQNTLVSFIEEWIKKFG